MREHWTIPQEGTDIYDSIKWMLRLERYSLLSFCKAHDMNYQSVRTALLSPEVSVELLRKITEKLSSSARFEAKFSVSFMHDEKVIFNRKSK